MTKINLLATVDIVLNQSSSSYVTYCQVCGWYGYPYEKIVEFEGFRSEIEEGFAVKFTEYNYDIAPEGNRLKHKHKHNPKLVQKLLTLL